MKTKNEQAKRIAALLVIACASQVGMLATAFETFAAPGNPYSEGTGKTRLSSAEKASLLQYADNSKARLDQALRDGQGKSFAEANAIYLKAIKAVVVASYKEKPRSELLMRIALNQALDLTFGIPSEDEKSVFSAGVLTQVFNQDLLTVILEDSIRLAIGFYQDDRTAIQNGTLGDLPYMKLAQERLTLARKWLMSVTEPVSMYKLEVAALQHFMNTAANEDQAHRVLYAEELIRVDDLLQENFPETPKDPKLLMRAVRVLRGELRRLQESVAQKLNAPSTGSNAIGMSFVAIPGGTFIMGSPGGETGRFSDEVQHRVTVRGFEMQVTAVTQAQYVKVMGVNWGYFGLRQDCRDSFVESPVAMCPNHPVAWVSWDNAQKFIDELNKTLRDGFKYRLPTEAEWEYAARAGSSTAYSFGDDASQLAQYAWYSINSRNQTHDVARREPNAYGLYDMHGNVLQWVQDWYGDYPKTDQVDPAGPAFGSNRVLRGGSWGSYARDLRSAYRGYGHPHYFSSLVGFRVVRTR